MPWPVGIYRRLPARGAGARPPPDFETAMQNWATSRRWSSPSATSTAPVFAHSSLRPSRNAISASAATARSRLARP